MEKKKRGRPTRRLAYKAEIEKEVAKATMAAVKSLYAMLGDDELSPSVKMSVIKEVLERGLGKPNTPIALGEQEEAEAKQVEIVLRIVNNGD